MHTQIPMTRAGRSVRVASVAGLAVLAGLLSGTGSSADEGAEPASFASECGVKDATVAATIDISADVPATGEVGRPVQPANATLTLTLARADLDSLLPARTDSVVSQAELAVKVTQGGKSAEARWALAAPSTPLPADGEVRLVHSGEVPYVTFDSAGKVTFLAGELTVDLLSTSAADGGTPTVTTLTCRPGDGQAGSFANTQVADVTSSGPSGTPEPSAGAEDPEEETERGIAVERREALADDDSNPCPVDLPVGEMDASEAPPPPPGDPVKVFDVPTGGTFGCAYAVGLANVRKLNGAMIINDPARNPALISVLGVKRTATRSPTAKGGYYLRIDSLGNLKLRDAESTFLTFGFQPVTAKVSFENGPITISTGNIGLAPNQIKFSTAFFRQSLRIHDVEINGTPLDVGPDCRTSKSFKVVLNGGAKYTHVFAGGLLEGEVDIPAFVGCGTAGEDLSPLFTASLSGPGNGIFMNQGTTCLPNTPNNVCPPTMPALPNAKKP
ncbi:DUF6801 domain-containing protein [Streptomyces sp. NPDC057682]|uniref:DUF6801 domain-containing protein n=1 Tax=unclassified Streptomyces TaxID=2593676 RepID=UPI00366579F1